LRAFEPADVDACLEVMRSNVPRFFRAHELAEYEGFLADMPCTYLVLVDERGAIIGCGGYDVDANTGTAVLTWGMVHREHHRRGLGALLLRERLARIAADPRAHAVRLDTSQHSRGFFERFGFEVVAHTPDGYAPGLDRYEMRLTLSPSDRESRGR
jgi:ribosomal protein S18 acetylase RimI-like enzyme